MDKGFFFSQHKPCHHQGQGLSLLSYKKKRYLSSEGARTHSGEKTLGSPVVCSRGLCSTLWRAVRSPPPHTHTLSHVVLTTQLPLHTGRSLQCLEAQEGVAAASWGHWGQSLAVRDITPL